MPDSSLPQTTSAVMTREEARAAGLTTYTSDKPCYRGHVGPRYVVSDRCPECRRLEKERAKKFGARCSVEGCEGRRDTNGYCPAHYHRWKAHGDPLAGGPCNGDGLKWLADHVTYQGDDCLRWPYSVSKNERNGTKGYGSTYIDGQTIGAHVVMCRMAHGEKPDEFYQAAHSCGKGHEGCVNPRHLRWATPAENAADRNIHGTAPVGERNSNAKLSEDEVRQIRALSGVVSQSQLARMFFVTVSTIKGVQSGRNWKHID